MNPIRFQSILVAIDFSSFSEAALTQAIWLARQSAARISLIHILPDIHSALMSASETGEFDSFAGDVKKFQTDSHVDSNTQLRKLIQKFNTTGLDVRCETLMGDPAMSIISAAQREKHDLVMVGLKGQSVWEKYMIGSTAKRLIRKCPTPVWAVSPEHCLAPKVVLAAIDFSDISQKAAIVAGKIASWAGAECHLLHVIDSKDIPEGVIERLNPGGALRGAIYERASNHLAGFVNSLNGKCGHFTSHVSWGIPSLEVVQCSDHLKCDLLILGTVGRTGIERVLLGNTSEKVLDSGHCSVLTVKADGFVSPV